MLHLQLRESSAVCHLSLNQVCYTFNSGSPPQPVTQSGLFHLQLRESSTDCHQIRSVTLSTQGVFHRLSPNQVCYTFNSGSPQRSVTQTGLYQGVLHRLSLNQVCYTFNSGGSSTVCHPNRSVSRSPPQTVTQSGLLHIELGESSTVCHPIRSVTPSLQGVLHELSPKQVCYTFNSGSPPQTVTQSGLLHLQLRESSTDCHPIRSVSPSTQGVLHELSPKQVCYTFNSGSPPQTVTQSGLLHLQLRESSTDCHPIRSVSPSTHGVLHGLSPNQVCYTFNSGSPPLTVTQSGLFHLQLRESSTDCHQIRSVTLSTQGVFHRLSPNQLCFTFNSGSPPQPVTQSGLLHLQLRDSPSDCHPIRSVTPSTQGVLHSLSPNQVCYTFNSGSPPQTVTKSGLLHFQLRESSTDCHQIRSVTLSTQGVFHRLSPKQVC